MYKRNHFTTLRGFIAASGSGGISLYGLWDGYAVPVVRALTVLGSVLFINLGGSLLHLTTVKGET